ncbi:hypothetical protein [Rhodothermus profundi]|uniref:Uncharacterized protein n=1 Tax=Rhodothermus profundi TaxID=633813 RepID=A0A1M6TKM3_9BACT|nr:hypothetical protein [Rhodothermus profundi]SHK57470.1 hypothetical protein SAMN04488087_1434 [Rhodothermus profundi]
MKTIVASLVAALLLVLSVEISWEEREIGFSVQEALAACTGCSTCFGETCCKEIDRYYCGMIYSEQSGYVRCYRPCFFCLE